jgi:scyllo-inositol 2-dehydrogenase (NADP+)
MRIVVAGLGVQGKKRLSVAGMDAVATVDPVSTDAKFRHIEAVPLEDYDGALICTPDDAKVPMIRYLLGHRKHVLVEKPLISETDAELMELGGLAARNGVVCYTAYNHRFEPHMMRLKETLDSGVLGKIYVANFFYGNGTARDVRNSPWRDKGMGVFADLGSHLLDWTLYLFGKPEGRAEVWRACNFENKASDYLRFGFKGTGPQLDYEMTLVSWKNTFRCDVLAEKGSAHVDGLCKWGPSTFTLRTRVLPSGRPIEEIDTLNCPDPTWKAEYDHFLGLCRAPSTNIDNDIWINGVFNSVRSEVSNFHPQ